MFVVLDSNVWISQLGLNTNSGEQFRAFVRKKRAVLAVPSVVRLEVKRELHNECIKKMDDIRRSHRYLDKLLGGAGEICLPDRGNIEVIVSKLIDNTGVEIRHIPLTLRAAKSSLDKIQRKVPPSSENREEFRDGVIWANCLELLSESDVWLVSQDLAFFKDKKSDRGLALNLQEEAIELPNKLSIFYGLAALLQEQTPGMRRVPQDNLRA